MSSFLVDTTNEQLVAVPCLTLSMLKCNLYPNIKWAQNMCQKLPKNESSAVSVFAGDDEEEVGWVGEM